ncbi:MAG: SBBP repeat-containing protein [Candidatus Krumholzibacteria bacterium]|nr:SBBP repeat-containing protein [Candidatus Krumholzibacteria bacterium]MDH4338164.1 SBBP repeat-containing protein [Candidatus Krumholzibacteria bacterium]MDH5270664.1 SBBP repeat-containing protein [Candidatus Krumholzibacteria bacterium]
MNLLRFVIASILVTAAPSVLWAATPVHLWSQRFGDIGYDTGNSIAIDGSGNILVAGQFEGTVNFGGGDLTSADSYDVFLCCYTPAGVHLWSERFGGTSHEFVSDLAVDPSGNIVLTGQFEDTTSFGGTPLVSAGERDIYLARFTSTGAHLWSQRFGNIEWEWPYALTTDGLDNIILAGAFTDSTDFGGGLLTGDYTQAFVATYDASGAHLWSRSFGGTFSDEALGVAVDAAGNVALAGYFYYTADFGGGDLTSAGSSDAFLAMYTPAGAHVWSQRFGANYADRALALAMDGAGNTCLAGTFSGTASFGGGDLTSAGGSDIYLASYDSGGSHRWSKRLGGQQGETPVRLRADAAGNMLLAGYFNGLTNLGGDNFPSAGDTDGFLARYDANGEHVWSLRLGDYWRDRVYDVAADASLNVYATGFFYGTINLGGDDLVSPGGYDVFLVNYSAELAEPRIASITDIGNDQGRTVKLRFLRSGYDADGSGTPVTGYEAYRRDDPPPTGAQSQRDLRAAGWTFVGAAPAHHEASYGIDVPTIGDSTETLGAYYSVFYVRATTADLTEYFDSAPDSGCSVDNLSPGVPTNLVYDDGVLTWDPCPDPDFDHFTVYGAPTQCFCGAIVVDDCPVPVMDVHASPYAFYFVTATDRSGNASTFTPVRAGATGTPRSYVLSVANYPNPFNPTTEIAFTIPSPGPVTLAIYDARGARIATLIDNQAHPPGPFRMEWSGVSDAGVVVSSGIYFARIEHAGVTRTRKLVMMK